MLMILLFNSLRSFKEKFTLQKLYLHEIGFKTCPCICMLFHILFQLKIIFGDGLIEVRNAIMQQMSFLHTMYMYVGCFC